MTARTVDISLECVSHYQAISGQEEVISNASEEEGSEEVRQEVSEEEVELARSERKS